MTEDPENPLHLQNTSLLDFKVTFNDTAQPVRADIVTPHDNAEYPGLNLDVIMIGDSYYRKLSNETLNPLGFDFYDNAYLYLSDALWNQNPISIAAMNLNESMVPAGFNWELASSLDLASTDFADDWNLASVNLDAQLTPWDWGLASPPEEDRYFYIGLRVDIDGQYSYYLMRIFYDATAPEQITGLNYTLTSIEDNNPVNKAQISWNPVQEEGLLTYVDYTIKGENHSVLAETNSIELDFGPDYNQRVALKARTVDRAGNSSETVLDTFYTSAFPGTINGTIIQGAERRPNGEIKRFITIPLAGENAKSFHVVPGNTGLSTEYDPDQKGQVRINGFDSGQLVNLSLRAVNNDEEESGYPLHISGITLSNYQPVIEEMLFPVEYAREDEIDFQWDAWDADGDEITTQLYLLQDHTVVEGFPVTTTANHYFYDAPDLQPLPLSGEYRWRIELSDEAHSNDPATETSGLFTIDDQPVIISTPDDLSGYSPREYLHVTIETGKSGVDLSGEKSYINIQRGGEILTQQHPFDEDYGIEQEEKQNGNQEVRLSIPLPDEDGEYKVIVHAANKAGRAASEIYSLTFYSGKPIIDTPLISEESHYSDNIYYYCSGYLDMNIQLHDEWGLKSWAYGFMNNPDDEFQAAESFDLSTISKTILKDYEPGVIRKKLVMKNDTGIVYLVVKATNIADAVTYSEPVAVYLDPLAPELKAAITGLTSFESQFYLADIDNLQIDYDEAASFDPAHNFHTSQDPEYNIQGSGILKAQYSVYKFDEKPDWHDKWKDEEMLDGALDIFKALPASERPEGEMIYQTAIRLLDKSGNQSLITSPVFALDSTPPANIIIDGLEGTLTGGTLVRITASAEDTHSGIAGYRLKLESAEGTVLTNHTPGNIDGWLCDITGEFSFALPKEGASLNDCRFIVQAENGAGLFSMKNSDGFDLEVAEALLINDNGPYFTKTTNLGISWVYNGTLKIASYDYRVLEKGDETDSVSWTNNGGTTFALFTDELIQGQEYVVEVRANYSDIGMAPLTARSLGVLIDTTAPAFAEEDGFTAPATGCHKDNLRIQWNLSEAESGLQSTELLIEKMVKVETAPGVFKYQRQKVSDWIRLPAREQGRQLIQTDAAGNSLDLKDGDRIYLTFRATNKAGLSTEVAWHQIVWDNSTPPVPVVMDQGAIIRAEQAKIKGLNFSYIESGDDPHSPTQYTWAYHVEHNVFASQDIKQDFEILEDQTILNQLVWKNGPAWCDGSETDLDLQHGDQVFFIVKSENAAGLESLGISNGITIDSTGPIISSVNITTGGNDGGRHYIKELYGLSVAIDAYTDVFNETITSYDLTFGSFDESYQYVPQSQSYTQSGTGDINEFTNLSDFQPENGQTSYFEANALNNAELQSTGLSMGVILDTIKPEVLYVDAKVKNTHVSINSSQIQRYTSELLFSWDVAFSFAPINTYHCDLFWSNDGSEGSYTKVSSYPASDPFWTINIDNESDLQDGYYYLRVTAENWALNTSEPKESPIVLIDTKAPVFNTFYAETPDWVDNTYASNEITLVFDAYDEHSGIEEYRFMMGTEMNPNLLTNGWQSCEVVTQENKPPFLLLDFSTLLGGDEAVTQGSHLRMWGQVKDKVGLWSPILQSQIIIIDKTPPNVTSVELPEYSNGTTLVRNINFTFNDSDILGNQYKFNSYIVDSDITLDRFQDYQFPEYFVTKQNTIEKQNSVYHKDSADELLNDHKYNCYVEVINRAGVSGQYISTDQVYIDHVKPRFIVDTSFGRFIDNTEYPNMEKHLVFNTISPLDPNYSSENADKSYFNFHYSIDDGLVQEPVEVKFYLDKPGNTFEEFNVSETRLSDGTLYDWSHWVSDYYMYRIRCTVTDQAGNVGTADDGNYFFLRYNQPPVIIFDDMQTTPGAPKQVTIDVTDFDSYSRDENNPDYYTYQWNLGLNTNLLGTPENMNTRTPTIRFLHSESIASFTDSNLNVRVTDSDGGFIIKTINIKVHNTYEGDLYYNEIWSDTHELTGDVKVSGWIYGTSENIKLTIASGANISIAQEPSGVNTDPLTEGYSLTIGNGNSLTVMPGAVMGPETDEYFWQGIYLKQGSNAFIGESEQAEPVVINQAIRGVAVENGAVSELKNVIFDHNFIGIHTFSTELLIEACDFKNSYYAGIKEDLAPDESYGQAFTDLADSSFGGENNQEANYMDYYDSSTTKIELGE
ncbi:MAG: hypothetical protein JXR70_16485 [Spirochaetales bacterium]|nr:hypothetical protein [Spirochaetales bacterium]